MTFRTHFFEIIAKRGASVGRSSQMPGKFNFQRNADSITVVYSGSFLAATDTVASASTPDWDAGGGVADVAQHVRARMDGVDDLGGDEAGPMNFSLGADGTSEAASGSLNRSGNG
jgi:hypothetical protein